MVWRKRDQTCLVYSTVVENVAHILCTKYHEASVLMQRLSNPTDTVLSNKIARNRIVLSFKDSLRRPLGRRPVYDWIVQTSEM